MDPRCCRWNSGFVSGGGINRTPEEVAVALLRERDKQRPLLPLNPPGHDSRIAFWTVCLGRARARTRGLVSLSMGLPREYCTLVCSPPRMVGDVKSSAFGRRN